MKDRVSYVLSDRKSKSIILDWMSSNICAFNLFFLVDNTFYLLLLSVNAMCMCYVCIVCLWGYTCTRKHMQKPEDTFWNQFSSTSTYILGDNLRPPRLQDRGLLPDEQSHGFSHPISYLKVLLCFSILTSKMSYLRHFGKM